MIILLRHAHRTAHGDNAPLSPQGHKQAEALIRLLPDLPATIQLYSSPKLRCQETLKPLSDHLKQPLRIDQALAEEKPEETHTLFLERIQNMLRNCQKPCILCTHADWLMYATNRNFQHAEFLMQLL